MSWEIVELRDVLEIKYGKDHKHLKNGHIPVYGSGGIMRFADNFLYDKESILIPRKGTLSNLFYLNIPFWSVDTIFYTIIKEGNNAKYLYYFLKSIDLTNLNVGSAVPSLSTEVLNKIEVLLPPLETQKRIANILTTYDDLIENNLKRIKLLEETAQNIYKEWFVNFRFPNYEHTEFEEESGLPVGWEKVIFSDLYSLNNGCAFKSEDYKNEGTPILRTRDYSTSFFIQMNDPIYLSTDLINNHSKYLVEELDFLIIMVGASIGKYGVVLKKDLPSLLNQNQWAIRTLSEFSVYNLFKIFSLQDVMRELLMKRTGAARDFFRASFLKELKVIKPNLSNILEFNDKVEPIMNMISLLLSQNQKLKEARDILLPRLMNRTIEV